MNLDVITSQYDLRIGNVELQRVNGLSADYVLCIDGIEVAREITFFGSSYGSKVRAIFHAMIDGNYSTVSVVSRHPLSRAQRMKRDKADRLLNQNYSDEEAELETDRYDSHVVSDILPDYRITLKDLIEENPHGFDSSLVELVEYFSLEEEEAVQLIDGYMVAELPDREYRTIKVKR